MISAIDYYIRESSNFFKDSISIVALFFSGLTLVWGIIAYKGAKKSAYIIKISEDWISILKDVENNPKYKDFEFTENPEKRSQEENEKYDVFCRRVWDLYQRIIISKLAKDPYCRQIMEWIAEYHEKWLLSNPVFFVRKDFWKYLSKINKERHFIPKYKGLAQKDDDIDWNEVAKDYNSKILGPFQNEMMCNSCDYMPKNEVVIFAFKQLWRYAKEFLTQVCEIFFCTIRELKKQTDKGIRNILVKELNEIIQSTEQQLKILDLGCGPGNLLKHIENNNIKIVGLDKSGEALELASKIAIEKEIDFTPREADMTVLESVNPSEFDIVVSVNSILPSKREKIDSTLSVVNKALKKDGYFLAILPSFDTIEYLHKLIEERYCKRFGREHSKRCIEQFKKEKRFDPENMSYADDGVNVQCYHTKESIIESFKKAGFVIDGELKKILYPWELTKKFDYGYFPEVEQEIWDWYVFAKKK